MRAPDKPKGLYALLTYDDSGAPMLGTTSRLMLTLDDCAGDLVGATHAEIVLFASLKQAVRWVTSRVNAHAMTAAAGLSLLHVLSLRFDD